MRRARYPQRSPLELVYGFALGTVQVQADEEPPPQAMSAFPIAWRSTKQIRPL